MTVPPVQESLPSQDLPSSSAHEDDVSALSTRSHSSASRVFGEVASVISQAKLILQGETPAGIEEENEEEDIPLEVIGSFGSVEQQERDTSTRMVTPRSQNLSTPNNNNNNTAENMVDFTKDPHSEMTWSRRIALFCMHRYKWYNPRLGVQPEEEETPTSVSQQDDKDDASQTNQAYPFTHSRRENPSLEKAWAYFEHVALTRYIIPEDQRTKTKKNIFTRMIRRVCCKGNQQMKKAEPGERDLPTRLYKPIWTPHKQLGDFGLGIGLYFSTLRAITVLTLIAGLINLPNFFYFASSDYNGDASLDFLNTAMRGSAVCADTAWVPCPDCNRSEYDRDFDDARLKPAWQLDEDGNQIPGTNVTFVVKNNCDGATYEQASVNYATILLIMIGIVVLNWYLERMEVAFDEDEQTAQDYSVVIGNPPGDATDPVEWRQFFRDNFDGAHVTACTIAVDNDLLVRSLVERREILRKIEMMLEPGTSLDTLTLARIAAKELRERKVLQHIMAMISPGVPELFGRVVVLNARVQGLAQQDYPATKVFLTFETEAGQRRVLSALNYGSRDVGKNNLAAANDPKHLFRGKTLLSASEPDEPNTVRWQDLNEKMLDRLRQQALTIFVTLLAILAIAFIIRITNENSVAFAAIAISIFNSAFPMMAKLLTDMEAHSSEGSKQRSLYLKIAVFRWVNTAVVITIITPFTATLDSGGLIKQIYALFFAEIFTTNAIQLLDPVGHLQRHFLAPRAATQDAMNINMQGQDFELAERYTNMTKIFFLALWYSAIYPGALFLCAFALFINYFTDRFSLMRTWKRAPQLGTKISKFSRRYFFSLAILAMSLLSSYYWAGFPFDNICPDENGTSFEGTWSVEDVDLPITLTDEDPSYRRCLQDFFRYGSEDRSFPFISKFQKKGEEWMSDEQETIADIFGWTSVAVAGIILLSFLSSWLRALQGLFKGTYDAVGDDQGIPFSEVPSISTYVPQVESSVFSYPLLACNIDGIDTELMDWQDPDKPDFIFYDLTRDAEVLLRGMDVSSKVVFSQIAHFPPPGKNKKNGNGVSK